MNDWEETLQRRRKELELAVCFARQVIEDLGKERGLDLLERAFERYGTDHISKLLEGVPLERRFERWREVQAGNVKKFPGTEIISSSDKEIEVRITKCASAQIFAENGLGEVCRRYCQSDFATAGAIHPKVKLVRTKALAFGDECCNHRWILEG